MSPEPLNPRYLAYCRSHGKTADQMMAADATTWPGGVMCGFQLWMSARQSEFRAAHPEAFTVGMEGQPIGIYDHAAWDAFLYKRADELAPVPAEGQPT